MPKRVILLDHEMSVRDHSVPQDPVGGEPMPPKRLWTQVFTDRQTGDTVEITFGREARDGIVERLTGGIVLAGGELPKL